MKTADGQERQPYCSVLRLTAEKVCLSVEIV